ncbi:hypothetical protein [Roseobacter sp. OBYS 0001]|uniref:hypothetical protein n=1 Tax=Roseobacter sp. OBYS 0001 TaxID=882651 RepID=UPI001BC6C3B5|nr:hypothetical protein [Roseobacter sp. OBYS 0001]GIT85400.1 hypothetical protein ROBYS_04160 [Roseobacter sp. OBYS 0001]
MLDLPPALLAHLQSRGARHAQLLVWVTVRERATGDLTSVGFWTGADHRDFMINGVSRPYYGAGSLIQIAPIVGETGVTVRTTRLTFSPASAEFQAAVALYDTNDARCDIHIANFDPQTGALIADPVRRYKGYIKGLDFTRPALGGEAKCEMSVQSAARVLTRTLPLKKSDTALRARHATDAFRKYADISGSIETAWGELRKGSRS